ncbi:uncharacterized protein TNCV_2233491 [Trichonephila clavipes]|nr:uncharacterized protein TNCV_2233491 [Trichonephila clavipes]
MGKCRSYRPRKRKFHGNQNTSTETASSNEEIMTASSLKLQQCNEVSNECNHHKGSSSSMEPVGAYRIFERSEDHRMLRYTDYYGDGDSKAFDAVKDIYGKDSVTKLECIGHIQRVGTRLRKLKSRNKGLGGKSAVIAAFFHCCSSKHQPKHGQCPVGDESWCKFQRAKASNIVYQDKSLGLPQNIVNTIKPVYMDLCDRNLLKKCLHGKTQNRTKVLMQFCGRYYQKKFSLSIKHCV